MADSDQRTPTPEEAKLPKMTTYVFGLLRSSPNRPQVGEAEAEAIQESHLAHIRRLREQGALIVAGPFMDDGELRGILIFRNRSIEEVRTLTQHDPALERQLLTLELHEWYAPTGLRVISPDDNTG
jgi:uncharacterized protein